MPALDHRGLVYIASDDRFLYTLDPSGAERWRFALGSRPSSSPVLAYDGAVLVGTASGRLWALGPNGRARWSFTAPSGPCLTPCLGRDGSIYLPAGGALFALSYRGAERWRYQLRADVTGGPTAGPDSTLYLGTSDRRLLALEASGRAKWELALPGRVSAAAVARDGALFVGAAGVHRISPAGGIEWSYPIPATTAEPVLRADGSVIAGAADGKVYALSGEGRRLWETRLGAPVRYAAALAEDGTIYVASEAETLYMLSGEGKLLGRFQAKQSVQYTTLGRDGELYAGAEDWILYRLEASSGRAPAGPARSAWPMAFHDGQHTGRAGALEDLEGPAAMILRELALAEAPELKHLALDDVELHLKGERFLPVHLSTLEWVLGYLAAEGVTIRWHSSGAAAADFPQVRERACRFLGALGSDGAREALLETVRRDEAFTVRLAALEALGEIGADPGGELAMILSREARRGADERLLLAGIDSLERILLDSPGAAAAEDYRVLAELSRGEGSRRVRQRSRELMAELRRRLQ